MANSKTAPRAYGMADRTNRQATPEQGLRGEQNAPIADPAAELSRRIGGAAGSIEIEEDSGVAWAEAARAQDAVAPPSPTGSNLSPPRLAAAALIGAATAGLMIAAGRWLRQRGETRARDSRPAFRQALPDRENFSQTRDAGPEQIRDISARDWDSVDEASDESFPASDPPSSY